MANAFYCHAAYFRQFFKFGFDKKGLVSQGIQNWFSKNLTLIKTLKSFRPYLAFKGKEWVKVKKLENPRQYRYWACRLYSACTE
jgi:hypothetical protein